MRTDSRRRSDEVRVFYDVIEERFEILRHGKPARVRIGFKDEDDWFDYKPENDPGFLERIEAARSSIRAGKGVRLEELPDEA